jgi:DNA-binding HxlR family transcriptional regulator
MAERIRGIWRARIIVALSRGPGHFNQQARDCRLSDPTAAARTLKKLLREGAVTRTIDKIGPPTITTWRLTDQGHQLVAPAKAVIASAAALPEEPEFLRSRPRSAVVAKRMNTGVVEKGV